MRRSFTAVLTGNLLLVAILTLSSIPLLAHHGRGATYAKTEVSLKGTVKEVLWRNPHIAIFLEQLTLTDPEMYMKPWVSDTKTWKKEPRKNVTWYGWYGLFSGLGELICAPMNANPFVSAGRGGD